MLENVIIDNNLFAGSDEISHGLPGRGGSKQREPPYDHGQAGAANICGKNIPSFHLALNAKLSICKYRLIIMLS